jgi:hypothetical protein
MSGPDTGIQKNERSAFGKNQCEAGSALKSLIRQIHLKV